MIMNFIYQNELRDSQIPVCRGVLILPYKNGYLSTVCCDIAFKKDMSIEEKQTIKALFRKQLFATDRPRYN